MTIRTLILTTGAIVALAAPAAAGAKGAPTRHAAKHAKVTKVAKARKDGGRPVIYIDVPGPLTPPAPPSPAEVCGQENDVLSDYGFTPIDCSAASADQSTEVAGSATSPGCDLENEVLSDYGYGPIACSVLVGQMVTAAQ